MAWTSPRTKPALRSGGATKSRGLACTTSPERLKDQDTSLVDATFQAYNDRLSDHMNPALKRLGAIQLRDLDAAIAKTNRVVKDLGFVGLCVRVRRRREKPFSDPFYDIFA